MELSKEVKNIIFVIVRNEFIRTRDHISILLISCEASPLGGQSTKIIIQKKKR